MSVELYHRLLNQLALPLKKRQVGPSALSLIKGCKAFDVTGILDEMHKFAGERRVVSREDVVLPFPRIWLEWDCKEYGFRPPGVIDLEHQGICVYESQGLTIVPVLQAGSKITVYEPTRIHPNNSGDAEASFVLCALALINSSHTESNDHRFRYATQQKLRKMGFGPLLGWSDVKIRIDETKVFTPAISGRGGWEQAQHEVRGHYHWYRSLSGQARSGRTGLWSRKWISSYTKGNPSKGFKQSRYKVVA